MNKSEVKEKQIKGNKHAHEHAEQEEKMIRLSMLEQDAKQLEQQLVMLEQQVLELQILMTTLDDIEKSKEKDEMLTSLGKNIFIKTALLSKDLLINVGAKTVVKKSIAETKKLIEKDIERISELKDRLAMQFQNIVAEMQSMI